MELETDLQTITSILEALQSTPLRPRYHWAMKQFKESLKRGWIFRSDVEDILIAIDERLDYYGFGITQFCELLDISFEEISHRPRAIASSVLSFDALRPEYFVMLLIKLEQFGFQIDAARFVDMLLPAVKQRSKKILSLPELEIFWYHKGRHKNEDVILYTDKSIRYTNTDHIIKLSTGYRISIAHPGDSKPQLMRIRAPKYRERPRSYRTTCPDCGYDWHKGDPESSMLHRREHRRRMNWLDPKPKAEMVAELAEKGLVAELVTWNSPKWKHTEMYNRALAFKREFRYDFVQWKSRSGEEDPDVQGYLFTNQMAEIIGACAFRNRSKDPDVKKWRLQWIWICPRDRRQGHLARRWPMFRRQFGDFVVESPVSDALQTFLQKQGDSELIRYNH